MGMTVQQHVGETCLICEKRKAVGIHICQQFICQSCEQKLINTETDDDLYKVYLEKLRKINISECATKESKPH